MCIRDRHQADVRIHQAHQNFQQAAPGQAQHQQLERAEEQHDGQQRQGDLLHISRKAHAEQAPQGHGIGDVGDDGRRVGAALGRVQHAQQQHGQNGPDGAQGHQAEAVVGGVAVVTDGGNAHAQGHDEGLSLIHIWGRYP